MDYELSRPVAVESIDKKGYITTVTMTDEESDALMKRFDLHSISSLNADIKITPHTATYHVTGTLTAQLEQLSVASGNPISKAITQDIDAWFTDQSKIASFEQAKSKRDKDEEDHEISDEKDAPDHITDGIIDIGEVCAQFFGLSLDPYPRGDDEEFGDYIEASEEDTKPNPFAVLEQLKDK